MKPHNNGARPRQKHLYGKWSEPGVPHLGWRHVGVDDSCEDGEDLSMVCEMCEHQVIRYVHTMEHDDYPGALQCGCVCAERMSGDYTGPRAQEDDLRRAAQRAKRSAQRSVERILNDQWIQSGNSWRLRSTAGTATVFPNAGIYNVRFALAGEQPRFSDEPFFSATSARKVATRTLAGWAFKNGFECVAARTGRPTAGMTPSHDLMRT